MPSFIGDLDDVFAYQTPKVVVIRDRYLGFVRLFFMGSIFVYIFIYNILYVGEHLSVKPAEGLFRVTVRHPTADHCNARNSDCMANFTPLTSLPYCTQSIQPYLTITGKLAKKKECQLWDYLESSIFMDQGMLIPTRIRRFDQIRGCTPSEENGWTCRDNQPYRTVDAEGNVQTGKGHHGDPIYDAFVGDVGRFSLMIDHGFSRSGGMQKDDAQMNGYWLVPDDEHKIPCGFKNLHACPKGSIKVEQPASTTQLLHRASKHHRQLALDANFLGRDADAALEVPVISRGGGDIVLISDILKAARNVDGAQGVFLDEEDLAEDEDEDQEGHHEETLRSTGMAIVIHVKYMNKPTSWAGLRVLPWSKTPEPYYLYTVRQRLAKKVKVEKTFDDPASPNRTVRVLNGIRIIIEQSGDLALWDNASFFAHMGAAMAMMALATTATELLLQYAMPRRQQYVKRKFQKTRDFNEDASEKEKEKEEDEEAVPLSVESRHDLAMHFLDAVEAQNPNKVIHCMDKLNASK
jgi:hypothetical protein